jgi:hypothetical protein
VLAARTVREAGDGPVDDLLNQFFATWAAWDWRERVTLHGKSSESGEFSDRPMSIITPTAPVRPCTEQVGAGFRDLVTQELYRAWEITEADGDPVPALLEPPPMHRRHAAWAVLAVPEAIAGRVRGRTRSLLTALEEAGVADLHAWPRPFEPGPQPAVRVATGTLRYAIGLGRNPPDAARLAEVTRDWVSGLPGVELNRFEGGAVPSLP